MFAIEQLFHPMPASSLGGSMLREAFFWIVETAEFAAEVQERTPGRGRGVRVVLVPEAGARFNQQPVRHRRRPGARHHPLDRIHDGVGGFGRDHRADNRTLAAPLIVCPSRWLFTDQSARPSTRRAFSAVFTHLSNPQRVRTDAVARTSFGTRSAIAWPSRADPGARGDLCASPGISVWFAN